MWEGSECMWEGFCLLLTTANKLRFLFQCVLSLIMLSSDDIFALINYASFVESSFIGVSIAGMLYLRYTQPKMDRPIKVSICVNVSAIKSFGGRGYSPVKLLLVP